MALHNKRAEYFGKIINLTDSVVSSYSNEGDIIKLAPSEMLPYVDRTVYYLIDPNDANKYITEVDFSSLVYAENQGIGRDGIKLNKILRLVDSARVYPVGD